jgi:uncharacterized protein (TIGR02265 family)
MLPESFSSLAFVPRPIRIRPDTPLVGNLVAEERFARFPSDFTIKGMFLTRLCRIATPQVLEAVRPRLVKAPALGRYLPFADYPQVDYSRLAHAIACDRYRNLDVAEAMRRLARDDVEAFASSQVGRIMLTLAGDARGVLLKLGDMYATAIRGGTVKAHDAGSGRVALEFQEFYGWLDCYPVGTIEGIVAHFRQSCEIELELRSEIDGTMLVTLHTP